MTCKDCIHSKVCSEYVAGLAVARGVTLNQVELEMVLECDDCEDFADRSRFVELPSDFPKRRITTDKPQGNYEFLMNFAYAKDRKVMLHNGGNQKDIDVCEYMTELDCEQHGFLDAEDYMNGACFECDSGVCSSGVLYALAVQAAEVRDRLKMYEDLAERALKERGTK